MKLKASLPPHGVTLVEVLVVLFVLGVVAGVLLPQCNQSRHQSRRIQCLGNLKQIGLAMRMWSNDHAEQFPWKVEKHELGGCDKRDGAGRCGGTGDPLEAINDGNLTVFRSLSNELNSPKVLVCSKDTSRSRAQTFDVSRPNAYIAVEQSSYFVGLFADETQPHTLLTGDRNVVGGQHENRRRTWSARHAKQVDASFDRGLHDRAGNVGLADGSASQVARGELGKLIAVANESSDTNTVLQFPE